MSNVVEPRSEFDSVEDMFKNRAQRCSVASEKPLAQERVMALLSKRESAMTQLLLLPFNTDWSTTDEDKSDPRHIMATWPTGLGSGAAAPSVMSKWGLEAFRMEKAAAIFATHCMGAPRIRTQN